MIKNAKITADDWGMSQKINEGILDLVNRNIVSNVSVMVNLPNTAFLLQDLLVSSAKISIHFNLTHGFPLSPAKSVRSLTDSSGQFLNFSQFLINYILFRIEMSEMKTEAMAQIDKFKSLTGSTPFEFDSHQHIHFFPCIYKNLLPIFSKYSLNKVRWQADRGHLASYLTALLTKRLYPAGNNRLVKYNYLTPADYKDLKKMQKKITAQTPVFCHPAKEVDISAKIDKYTNGRVIEYQSLINLFS